MLSKGPIISTRFLCGLAFAKRRRASDQDCEGPSQSWSLARRRFANANPHRKRVLMMGPLDNTFCRKSLEMFWSLTDIDLIDAEHVDKSGSKQHKQVFSKLRLFELPYRKIHFLDLDAVLQRRAPPKFLT